MVSLDEINYIWIQNNLWTRHIGYKYGTSSFFFDMMKIDVIVRNSTQFEKYDSPITNFMAAENYARPHRHSVDVKLLSITVMSNQCQGIWNYWQLNRLFRLITKKPSKLPYNSPFVRGIYPSQVDSPHKGPVIWKTFPCLYVIINADLSCHFIGICVKELRYFKPLFLMI